MMQLIRSGSFDASHRLPGYPGKCWRTHGHTYHYKVSVKADKLSRARETWAHHAVIDFGLVKKVINRLDHRHLNRLMKMPTAEVIAEWIGLELQKAIKGHCSHHGIPTVPEVEYVELMETDNCTVVWTP